MIMDFPILDQHGLDVSTLLEATGFSFMEGDGFKVDLDDLPDGWDKTVVSAQISGFGLLGFLYKGYPVFAIQKDNKLAKPYIIFSDFKIEGVGAFKLGWAGDKRLVPAVRYQMDENVNIEQLIPRLMAVSIQVMPPTLSDTAHYFVFAHRKTAVDLIDLLSD